MVDLTQFRNLRPAQGAGLLTGLLEGAVARGGAEYANQQYQNQLARQGQTDTLRALQYGIDPSRLQDQGYLAQVAQQRMDRANRPIGTSEFERLVAISGDESLPQAQRDLVNARLQTISRDPNALFQQAFSGEQGKLQAQQGIKPQLEQDVARSKEIGKGMAERELSLPKVEGQADRMLASIDDVLTDTQGLEQSVGGVGGFLGRQAQQFPLTEAQRRFIPKVEQLQGQTFLQAFESLKGGGQITEIEGKKAEQAIARLNTVQNPEDFAKALQDLREIVVSAKNRAGRGLNETTQQPMQQQVSQPVMQDNNDPLGIR